MSVRKLPPFDKSPLRGSVRVVRKTDADFANHRLVSHTQYVVSYVDAGNLQLVSEPPALLSAGDVLFIPAGVPHKFAGGHGVDLWGVAFCAHCVELDEQHVLMTPFRRARLGSLPTLRVPMSRRRKVSALFQDLQAELKHADLVSKDLVRCQLHLLLGELTRCVGPSQGTQETGTLVGDALTFIHDRCLERISLQDVASAVGRTPGHVATRVKETTGYTVGEWIVAGKVSEAAARLAHTDDGLEDIANQVGWRDRTHFTRQFKKVYGITPAAWRRQHRKPTRSA